MRTPEIEKALDEIESKNYSAALKLLSPLAESGSAEAICNLATLYQSGWGVRMDGKKAVELYQRVAQLNIRDGCLSGVAYHNLATIYTTGLPGVERDLETAHKYDELARELGFEM